MTTQISSEFLKAIAQQHDLSDVEVETLMLALSGASNAAIADQLGITEVAVRKRLGKVYKKFNIEGTTSGKLTDLRMQLLAQSTDFVAPPQHQDLSQAPDLPVFYGRTEELQTLQTWVLEDKCRLVALIGLAGIGKTSLAVRFAKQIASEFDFVVWRSLRNAPKPLDLTLDLLQFFGANLQDNPPEDAEAGISEIMEYLRKYRCLIILDEVEEILRSGDRFGRYRQGYEDYGSFFRRIGEEQHQSCIIVAGQDKPKEIALLQGENQPIRLLQIAGLKEPEAKKFLQDKGITGQKHWTNLIQTYRGNPLALKMIAHTIQQIFNSDLDSFIEHHTILINDIIIDALDQQFNRLSELEKTIMRYLAGQSTPISFLNLRQNLPNNPDTSDIIRAIESLVDRSMIEKTIAEKPKAETLFTLQPVVKKYIIKQHLTPE